jgi:hypothetical protein
MSLTKRRSANKNRRASLCELFSGTRVSRENGSEALYRVTWPAGTTLPALASLHFDIITDESSSSSRPVTLAAVIRANCGRSPDSWAPEQGPESTLG